MLAPPSGITPGMTDLDKKAFGGIAWLFAAMAALIFIPAGTLDYWQAWLFLAVFFCSSLAVTLYLMKYDQGLLKRRMQAGPVAEKEKAQKIVMSLVSVAFIALLVVPALDRRFHWSNMPPFVALIGDGMIALSYLAIFLVFRENSFSSATIEIDPDQKVISSGPYAIVRHPMYAGGQLLFVGGPLALGSWWGVLVAVLVFPALIWRLIDEENFLAKNLPGYLAYMAEVRYRLVPLVW
jgi:protein-S-isoprenylcysteine O-methyltransferase Ste14